MSRSYRKTPEIHKDSPGSWRKYAKTQANQKVRRTKNIPNGRAYKKVYCSWEICDWKSWWSITDSVRFEIKQYERILERKEEGNKIWKYDQKVLNKGLPIYEQVLKERRRYKR